MKSSTTIQELNKIIEKYNASILYTPLQNEVDYHDPLFPIKYPAKNIILPTNKTDNPLEWAIKCNEIFKNDLPLILIPGKEFDIYGTRHGRGFGWYDRFLSQVPATWLRIGIVNASKLHFEKLTRKPWDEPVDWIVAFDHSATSSCPPTSSCSATSSCSSWKVYKTFARTFARLK